MGGVGVPTAHTTRMCGRHGRWQRGHGTGARARHAGPERQSHTRRALPDMHAGTARMPMHDAVRVGQRRQGPWATTGRTQWTREGHGARGRRGLKMRARSGDGGDASGAGVRGAGQGRAQAQPHDVELPLVFPTFTVRQKPTPEQPARVITDARCSFCSNKKLRRTHRYTPRGA